MPVHPVVTPSGLVLPDYQSAGGYRRDVWRGRLRVTAVVLAALLTGALLLAAAVAARAEVRRKLAHRERVRAAWAEHRALLADEALCMNYAAPPTQPVYSEPKGEAGSMLRQPDCLAVSWVIRPPERSSGWCVVMAPPTTRRSAPISRPAPEEETGEWTAAVRQPLPVRRYPLPPRSAVAFVGGRRSAGGTERLVTVVAMVPDGRPGAPRPRFLNFVAYPFTVAGPRPAQKPALGEWGTTALPMRVQAGAHARVLAGQRDPADPARFTIGYELDDVRGTVAGRLNDDGTVSLEIMAPHSGAGPARDAKPREADAR